MEPLSYLNRLIQTSFQSMLVAALLEAGVAVDKSQQKALTQSR